MLDRECEALIARELYDWRTECALSQAGEAPTPEDIASRIRAALTVREDTERPEDDHGALLPCVDGMADNYGRPFASSSASGTSDPMPARASEGQRSASSAAAEPSTSPCSRPGCVNTAPGHECAQTGREDAERPRKRPREWVLISARDGSLGAIHSGPQLVPDGSNVDARVRVVEVQDTERPDGQTTNLLAVEALDETGLVRVEIDLAESPYLLAVSQARNLGELLIEAADRLTHAEQEPNSYPPADAQAAELDDLHERGWTGRAEQEPKR